MSIQDQVAPWRAWVPGHEWVLDELLNLLVTPRTRRLLMTLAPDHDRSTTLPMQLVQTLASVIVGTKQPACNLKKLCTALVPLARFCCNLCDDTFPRIIGQMRAIAAACGVNRKITTEYDVLFTFGPHDYILRQLVHHADARTLAYRALQEFMTSPLVSTCATTHTRELLADLRVIANNGCEEENVKRTPTVRGNPIAHCNSDTVATLSGLPRATSSSDNPVSSSSSSSSLSPSLTSSLFSPSSSPSGFIPLSSPSSFPLAPLTAAPIPIRTTDTVLAALNRACVLTAAICLPLVVFRADVLQHMYVATLDMMSESPAKATMFRLDTDSGALYQRLTGTCTESLFLPRECLNLTRAACLTAWNRYHLHTHCDAGLEVFQILDCGLPGWCGWRHMKIHEMQYVMCQALEGDERLFAPKRVREACLYEQVRLGSPQWTPEMPSPAHVMEWVEIPVYTDPMRLRGYVGLSHSRMGSDRVNSTGGARNSVAASSAAAVADVNYTTDTCSNGSGSTICAASPSAAPTRVRWYQAVVIARALPQPHTTRLPIASKSAQFRLHVHITRVQKRRAAFLSALEPHHYTDNRPLVWALEKLVYMRLQLLGTFSCTDLAGMEFGSLPENTPSPPVNGRRKKRARQDSAESRVEEKPTREVRRRAGGAEDSKGVSSEDTQQQQQQQRQKFIVDMQRMRIGQAGRRGTHKIMSDRLHKDLLCLAWFRALYGEACAAGPFVFQRPEKRDGGKGIRWLAATEDYAGLLAYESTDEGSGQDITRRAKRDVDGKRVTIAAVASSEPEVAPGAFVARVADETPGVSVVFSVPNINGISAVPAVPVSTVAASSASPAAPAVPAATAFPAAKQPSLAKNGAIVPAVRHEVHVPSVHDTPAYYSTGELHCRIERLFQCSPSDIIGTTQA